MGKKKSSTAVSKSAAKASKKAKTAQKVERKEKKKSTKSKEYDDDDEDLEGILDKVDLSRQCATTKLKKDHSRCKRSGKLRTQLLKSLSRVLRAGEPARP